LLAFLIVNQVSAFVLKLGDYRSTALLIRMALGIPT
jgi:hypothetical protein